MTRTAIASRGVRVFATRIGFHSESLLGDGIFAKGSIHGVGLYMMKVL